MIKGDQAIVGVIRVALGEVSQAPPRSVFAAMGPLTIFMGSATGKITVSQKLYVKHAAAPT